VKQVAILTDILNFDPAYSICRVVADQCKMLVRNGYTPRLLVRSGFHHLHDNAYAGAEIVELDHGDSIGNNEVVITETIDLDVFRLQKQMTEALADVQVVLTHDLIYQENLWLAHLVAKRIAHERGDLHWLHWVHSSTKKDVWKKTKQYRKEMQQSFPNSHLVAMHPEEVNRKGTLFGYEWDKIDIIPNPVDFLADFHPAAVQAVEKLDLMRADIVGIYPCRLDRGKQPHVLIEVFAGLQDMGYDARVVIVDLHSTAGDKADYRKQMQTLAEKRKVPVLFTSSLEGEENGAPYNYCIPHKAVMDLMQLADVLVHPSMSECDPLILPEAAWARCGLVLNFDLPVFRQYDGRVLFGKFSSSVDVNTGMPGGTKVEYGNRAQYMRGIAAAIAYEMEQNPAHFLHRKARQERSLEGAWHKLEGAIERQ